MARSVLRPVAAVGIVIVAVAAAIGWLYLLREWHALGAGRRFAGALPLERLARGDAQPLARLAVAWLPAGAAAGVALGAIGIRTRMVRALTVAVVAWLTIFLTSAASEAITGSTRLSEHLSPVAGRTAVWLATGLMALGALIVPPTGRRGRGRAPATDATRPRGGAGAAA
ncbi:MAG: hypothetical protein ACXVFN_13685 [Solirubrobacteraceae bacterium]